MSRWKASAIHLSISLVIGSAVFALLFFVWYPGPLFTVTGGHKLMLLLLGVDVVIGPLLTLAVFKAGKRGLRLDLSVIAMLQFAALCYGLGVILIGRPAYLVFDGDQFLVVHANAIAAQEAARGSKPEFRDPGFAGPITVALALPDAEAERQELSMRGLRGERLERMPWLYGDYAGHAARAASKAIELTELRFKGPRASKLVDSFLARHDAGDRPGCLPLVDGVDAGAVVVSRNDGRVLGLLDVDPR